MFQRVCCGSKGAATVAPGCRSDYKRWRINKLAKLRANLNPSKYTPLLQQLSAFPRRWELIIRRAPACVTEGHAAKIFWYLVGWSCHKAVIYIFPHSKVSKNSSQDLGWNASAKVQHATSPSFPPFPLKGQSKRDSMTKWHSVNAKKQRSYLQGIYSKSNLSKSTKV